MLNAVILVLQDFFQSWTLFFVHVVFLILDVII